MTDQEAQSLRKLVARHGFDKVILELWKIAAGYSRSQPRWFKVKSYLRLAYGYSLRRTA